MKRTLFLFILFIARPVSASNVLFLDLNDTGKEIQACAKGVAAASPRDANGNPTDHLYAVSPTSVAALKNLPGMKDFKYDPSKPIGAAEIEAYVHALEHRVDANGNPLPPVKIDSIVISGHDGNGQYFGSQGGITSSGLKWVLDRNPVTKQNTEMLIQWGCYTGNANACQNVWGHEVSENITTSVGFTGQGPGKDKPANWALLKDVCSKRKELIAATTDDQYDQIFRKLEGVQNWNVGICKPDGVCSMAYARKDPKTGKPLTSENCFHTFQELKARCAEFDPRGAKAAEYIHYLRADPGYENTPTDDPSSPIMKYYDDLQLWVQCMKTDDNPLGQMMSSPSQVVRLRRFVDVKDNLLRFHQRDISQYNKLMQQVGLGQYALDDLTNMSRAEIVRRTSNGVVALEALYKSGTKNVGNIKVDSLWTMAVQYDQVLRVLQPRCIPMSWVHSGMGMIPSDCIAPYGETPQWPPRTQ